MSETASARSYPRMNTEERKHWISWMATIAEGVAGVMAVEGSSRLPERA